MSYAALYKGTKPIIRLAAGSGGGTPYVRPSEWPDISNPTPSDCFVGLYGVADHDSNHVALRCSVSSGTYDVDWGDGNVSLNVASNTNAEHLYDYAAITSINPVDGVKPVTVIVTPSSGSGDLTAISLQHKHSQAGLPTGTFSVNWLDVTVKAPAATSLAIGGTVVVLHLLQQARIISHAVTNMSSMFDACFSLQSVPLFNTAAVTDMTSMLLGCRSLQSVPLFNTAAVTNMSTMLRDCRSLQSVPLFNTSAVTNMQSMFNGCISLQSVPLFNTAAVTNMSSMFDACRSLQSVPLFNTAAVTNMSFMLRDCSSLQSVPLFNTSAVTSMWAMFQGCSSLQSVPLFNTSAVTDMRSMFNVCPSLQSVPLFNTSAVTSMGSMLRGCSSLQSVPLFNTAAVTNMSEMFGFCSSLQSVPLFNTSAVTNMSTMLRDCTSLQSIPQLSTAAVSSAANIANFTLNCRSLSKGRTNGIRFAISYNGCKLSRAALVDIFEGLGTASGSQTIDVRNNFGTASLTAADKLIAENKGWTVQDS